MKNLRIGLTHGDINGIGYEMILKVMANPEILDICTPVIFGIPEIAQQTLASLQLEEKPTFHIVRSAADALDGRINLVNILAGKQDAQVPPLTFGQQTEEALRAEADSLTKALQSWTNREIDLLVTLPGHLDNDADSHALCDFIHQALGGQNSAFDWIMNGPLRMLLLHPLETSTELGLGLASERLIADITDIHHSLRADFGDLRPRIALVSTLAKTADDVRVLQEQGVEVFGPQDPQQFLAEQRQGHYDACLFLAADEAHHQLVSQTEASTLIGYVSNLPLVLTYPLLPVSYPLAGKDCVDATPLREAIYAGIDIYRSRIRFRHATRNVLAKYWNPRGRDDFKLDLSKEE